MLGGELLVVFSFGTSGFVNANRFSDSSIFVANSSANNVLNTLSLRLNDIDSRANCFFWSSFVEILPYVD